MTRYTLGCRQRSSINVPFVSHWQTARLANVNSNVIDRTRMWQKNTWACLTVLCNVNKNGMLYRRNVAKNMDNIRDRWNEVNGKSLHVDKQTFIEKITPYCMHKWSFKEWMWCRFLKLSSSILGVLGGNIACYCCYIANQTGCMENGARCSDKNVKILVRYQLIVW